MGSMGEPTRDQVRVTDGAPKMGGSPAPPEMVIGPPAVTDGRSRPINQI